MKNYLFYIALITLVLLGVQYFLQDSLPYNTFFVVPAFCIITVVTHLLLMKAAKAEKGFNMYFLAAMGAKMLAYLIFLAVMHIALGGITLEFVWVFFTVYLVFTVFEMIYLYPIAKGKK